MFPIIDHLIFAAPSLELGMDVIEEIIGVRPVVGGQHKGRGTHNALLTFGDIYFEVIAPDPSQPYVSRPLWMKIDQAMKPKLWTWATITDDLFELEKKAIKNQIPLGRIESGTRSQTNGDILKWQLTEPVLENEDGIMPFFLDWGDSIHPSRSLISAGEIIDFRAIHPNTEFIKNQLRKLGVNLNVEKGIDSHLEATIRTLKGEVIHL